MPNAAKIGIAGWNAYRTSIRSLERKLGQAYQADTLAKSCARRKGVEDVDDPLEGSHDFSVILSKFGNSPSLMLENVHDGVNRMTFLELHSERMVD